MRVIQRDSHERKTAFHPRPYFRLFVTWLMDFNSADSTLDSSNFQVTSNGSSSALVLILGSPLVFLFGQGVSRLRIGACQPSHSCKAVAKKQVVSPGPDSIWKCSSSTPTTSSAWLEVSPSFKLFPEYGAWAITMGRSPLDHCVVPIPIIHLFKLRTDLEVQKLYVFWRLKVEGKRTSSTGGQLNILVRTWNNLTT